MPSSSLSCDPSHRRDPGVVPCVVALAEAAQLEVAQLVERHRGERMAVVASHTGQTTATAVHLLVVVRRDLAIP